MARADYAVEDMEVRVEALEGWQLVRVGATGKVGISSREVSEAEAISPSAESG